MSGFIKKSTYFSKCASTGIPSLDSILKLDEGSLTCIQEDENSFFHKTLLQMFISENSEETYVFSKESKNFVKFNQNKSDKILPNFNNQMSIAWRYSNLTLKDTQFKYDLMDKTNLENNTFINLDELINMMKTKNRCCFAIFSLLSPLAQGINVLPELRRIAKNNNHVVLLSAPVFLIKENVTNFFDNIIQLHSILNLPHEKSLYNCLIEIIKLNRIKKLRVNELESVKYGVILKSKKILIEKIEIPPEEGQPEDGCSSF